MDSVVIICSEKTGCRDMELMHQVLGPLRQQAVSEIVMVRNTPEPSPVDGVTNLYLHKRQPYELASCVNMALKYCEESYSQPFHLVALSDDCIPGADYIEAMTRDIPPMTVRQAMVMYHQWPPPADIVDTFVPASWLHFPVSSLDEAKIRFQQPGYGMQLFGLISLVWSERTRGLRYDEQYNGHWGLEDTDFCFQLLQRGYCIENCSSAHAWHVHSGWKGENHQGDHHDRIDNPNERYFCSKWLAALNR